MITTPPPTPDAEGRLYSLDPLMALGRDALAPAPAAGIEKISLLELAVGWDNVFQEVVVRRASDVFACAAADGAWYDPLPPGARLVWAVLRFDLAGVAQPCLVEIWPPHTLILTPPSAARLIDRWFAAHGFVVTRKLI